MHLGKKLLRRLVLGPKADSDSYVRYLRGLGMRIGSGVHIYDPQSVLIDETRPWLVEIGQNVQIARGVTILTHGYEWAVLKAVYGEVLGSAGKVTIGDNVFLGVNSLILKGVTVGSNTVIGAGSVVTRDIPANSVAAGCPARVRMTLEEYRQKRKAAQLPEAREMAAEYQKTYGKMPGPTEFREFYWLFTDASEGLPPSWEQTLSLMGNEEDSRKALEANEKQFRDLEDFLHTI